MSLPKTALYALGAIAGAELLRHSRIIRTHETGIVLGVVAGLAISSRSAHWRRAALWELAAGQVEDKISRLGQDLPESEIIDAEFHWNSESA